MKRRRFLAMLGLALISPSVLIGRQDNKIEAPDGTFSVGEFYAYLKDVWDDDETLEFKFPLAEVTKTSYTMENSWVVNEETHNFIGKGRM